MNTGVKHTKMHLYAFIIISISTACSGFVPPSPRVGRAGHSRTCLQCDTTDLHSCHTYHNCRGEEVCSMSVIRVGSTNVFSLGCSGPRECDNHGLHLIGRRAVHNTVCSECCSGGPDCNKHLCRRYNTVNSGQTITTHAPPVTHPPSITHAPPATHHPPPQTLPPATTDRLMCLRCHDIEDPRTCDQYYTCDPHMACATVATAVNNQIKFSMSCMTYDHCLHLEDIAGPARHLRCIECCHKQSFCNKDMCAKYLPQAIGQTSTSSMFTTTNMLTTNITKDSPQQLTTTASKPPTQQPTTTTTMTNTYNSTASTAKTTVITTPKPSTTTTTTTKPTTTTSTTTPTTTTKPTTTPKTTTTTTTAPTTTTTATSTTTTTLPTKTTTTTKPATSPTTTPTSYTSTAKTTTAAPTTTAVVDPDCMDHEEDGFTCSAYDSWNICTATSGLGYSLARDKCPKYCGLCSSTVTSTDPPDATTNTMVFPTRPVDTTTTPPFLVPTKHHTTQSTSSTAAQTTTSHVPCVDNEDGHFKCSDYDAIDFCNDPNSAAYLIAQQVCRKHCKFCTDDGSTQTET